MPEVTLVASRCLAALAWRRREAIPNCMLAMAFDGQSPYWSGTSGQFFLTVAIQRPRWGTSTHHRSGGCARTVPACVSLSPRTVAAGDAPTSACTQLHQHISGLELCACSCIIPAVLMTFQVLTGISGAGLAEGTNPSCKGWSGRALYPGVSH